MPSLPDPSAFRDTSAPDGEPVEEWRRAAERAERLHEISVKLSAMRDTRALLRYIIETAAEVIGCEAASVLLYNERAERLRFVAATGSDVDELANIPVPLDDSIAGFVFTKDQPIVVGNVSQEARHYAQAAEHVSFDARSLVGVPMRLEGEPVGVLEALNKHDEGGFTSADVRTLSVIAAQAAVAIRNASQMQELEEANDKLSRLDELKSDFLALASHELRTPLSTILGVGDALRESVPDLDAAGPEATDGEPVEMVMSAAERMKDVVEAMTQMQSLRSDAATFERRPLDLQHVLRRACNDATLGDAGRKRRLTLDVPDAEDLTVEADAKHLGLVLKNLLENAFQFSPADDPVTVRARRDGSAVHITVRDEGVGLSGEDTERIFEDFYQVEDALTRTHGGLGLGLTMARELAQQHGGRLYAESDGPGQGTTMHLRLPLAK